MRARSSSMARTLGAPREELLELATQVRVGRTVRHVAGMARRSAIAHRSSVSQRPAPRGARGLPRGGGRITGPHARRPA